MIKQAWEQILNDQDIRQNLSKIRQETKNKSNLNLLLQLIDGKQGKLIHLLGSEDAKTRKNAALLMGDLGQQEFLTPIWQAYQQEQQRFVKGSYLAALGYLDYREYLEEIKVHLDELTKAAVTEENQKHIIEEMRELSALIVRIEGISAHQFIGWEQAVEVMLLTNRNHAEKTRDELIALEPGAKTKIFGAGVVARVESLKWAREIRTYHELLFVVNGMVTCPMDPVLAAEMIIKSQLLEFLSTNHSGIPPFYFRVEMKSKKALDQKSAFVKKLSAHVEQLSERKLINSTDNYEVELRIIENKQGEVNILVKLFTLKDSRFNYRKEVTPTSIKPVNAALTVALAKEFLAEDAQVLDPFCGVGTMLIERHKAVRANTTYGIDIQESAILKARKNTAEANQIIHYINRDFFQFQHNYLFDEVITNMPFKIGHFTEAEVYQLYQRFFEIITKFIKNGAVVVLYSHNKDFVQQIISKAEFRLLQEYEISQREETHVLILKYVGKSVIK